MSTFQPKISIVIPVYNGANYMAQAIDSALAQDYPNFEVIVVNDGSSDGGETDRIARSYGGRIRYLVKENGGVATALNMAIEAMDGSYFSWLSHDDIYVPDKLSHQVRLLDRLENRDTILYSNYTLIDERSRPTAHIRLEERHTSAQLDMPLFPLTRGMIHGCTLLIPRRLFDRYGTFDASLRTTQDYDLWFRMLRTEKLHFDPLPTVLSRVHPEQGSRTMPEVEAEGIALWRRFIDDVSADEAAEMYGTQYRYLCSTTEFLRQTPYEAVAPVAQAKAVSVLSQTLVSVVIPFRNRVAWTLEALRSAQRQSHQKIDILLVDDGSDEDVTPIVQAAESDLRVRYIRQKALGAAAARNTGLANAAGRYIAFLDSDDWWHADKVARQLAHMEAEALVVSHTDYLRRDEEFGQGDCRRDFLLQRKCISRGHRFLSDSYADRDGPVRRRAKVAISGACRHRRGHHCLARPSRRPRTGRTWRASDDCPHLREDDQRQPRPPAAGNAEHPVPRGRRPAPRPASCARHRAPGFCAPDGGREACAFKLRRNAHWRAATGL